MALEDMFVVVGGPFVQIWNGFILALPGIIAAILILLLGYLIGSMIGGIVKKILDKTKIIPNIIQKMDLTTEIGGWNLTKFFGLITKWYIFLVFLNPAAEVVQWSSLASFFETVALWIPNIILAIVMVMAGYILAEYIAKHIKDTKSKRNSMLAAGAKAVTIILVAMVALKQIGIQISVAENSFLIILAGIMLGLAIAFGMAFKDDAKGLIKEIVKRI
jgi:hypothetical protein